MQLALLSWCTSELVQGDTWEVGLVFGAKSRVDTVGRKCKGDRVDTVLSTTLSSGSCRAGQRGCWRQIQRCIHRCHLAICPRPCSGEDCLLTTERGSPHPHSRQIGTESLCRSGHKCSVPQSRRDQELMMAGSRSPASPTMASRHPWAAIPFPPWSQTKGGQG